MDDYDQVRRLRHTLVAPEHRQLYQQSPTFRLMIDQLSSWLPSWMDALAAQARDTDRQLAEATELAKRATLPARFIVESDLLARATPTFLTPATVAMLAATDRYPGADGRPYVDPDEAPRLKAIHRALRSTGTKGATAQSLAGSGLPIDVVARFLRYLEAQGWARSSPHDPDDPDGARTWWPFNNWERHPYVGDWQGRSDTPCRYTVLGVRCQEAASAPVHAVGGPLSAADQNRTGWVSECPDGGRCHHQCLAEDTPAGCFRVRSCGPLSGVFPDDRWPDEIVAANIVQPLPPVEDDPSTP